MRILSVCLLACLLSTQAGAAPFLVGAWFGQGQPHDKSEMWLARMLPNGEFHAQFRSCIKGKALDTFDDGTWSLKGDIETIDITRANGFAVTRHDLYRIVSHDDRHQRYIYLPTGFVYNSSRVDAKFKMPDCGLTS